jgi:hypothetical protein
MDDAPGFSVADPPEDDEGGDKKPAKGRKPRRRDALAGLLDTVDLWRSPDGVAHASMPMNGLPHREHMRVASRDFRQWVVMAYYRAEARGMSGQALAETVALAEARAAVSGLVRRPWRRVARGDDGAIWLDLGGGDPLGERRSVKIIADRWEVAEADAVPVAFLRAGDARALPEPMAGEANTEMLRRFVNVAGADDLYLAWAWIVCALCPFETGGSYPIAVIHGEQGTGKSLATRFLQSIVDPSALIGRAAAREERDLFVSAANRHVIACDNLSGISESLSDAFCRVATGGGFSARSLHTDADESVLHALKPLILNGIPATLLSRADLASRSISLELARLPERRREKDLIADFGRALPGLLGLACDGVAAALRNLHRTTITADIRMLDPATWAEAASEGLGIEPGRIAAAWEANATAAARALVESDDLALAIVALLDAEAAAIGRAEWRGTPSALYTRLAADFVTEAAKRSPQWPRSANGMGTRLRRLAPALRAVHGIDASPGRGGADGGRFWVVRRL